MSPLLGCAVPRLRGCAVELRNHPPRNRATPQPRNLLVVALMVFLGSTAAIAQTARIASDFEIQQMERQAAREHDFIAQFQAHMNLGDSRATRNEIAPATAEYRQAADIAMSERLAAHKDSDLKRYAEATMCVALAYSKLDRPAAAFELLEEAIRYSSDDPKAWNIYASTMTELGHPSKSVAAARNAVAIEEARGGSSPTIANRIDLAIYNYSLGFALSATNQTAEAEEVLRKLIASLRAKEFDGVRKQVARMESFEVYSTVRGEGPAYLSLLNRSQLRLAKLYEQDGNVRAARKVYQDLLHDRTDEPNALAALARLSRTVSESIDAYSDAFNANPFSIALIRDYEQWLKKNPTKPNDTATDGALVRRALEQRAMGENIAARATLDSLAAKFPQNDVVQYLGARNDIDLGDLARARSRIIAVDALRRDIDDRLGSAAAPAPAFLSGATTEVAPSTADLRRLMAFVAQQRITPEQRVTLDKLKFTSSVVFESAKSEGPAKTIFESGSIDGIPFRFSEPIAFAGVFAAKTPLVLTYRFLGVTDLNGANALLVEPLKLEVPR